MQAAQNHCPGSCTGCVFLALSRLVSCPAAARSREDRFRICATAADRVHDVQAGVGEAVRLAGAWPPLCAVFSVAAFSATISALLPAQRASKACAECSLRPSSSGTCCPPPQVDCTKEVELCREHLITGFPSIRVFRKGHDEISTPFGREHEAYRGEPAAPADRCLVDCNTVSRLHGWLSQAALIGRPEGRGGPVQQRSRRCNSSAPAAVPAAARAGEWDCLCLLVSSV